MGSTRKLLEACTDGSLSEVQAALQSGAAVGHAGRNGMTALHFAASLRDPVRAVGISQLLLASKAPIDPRDVWGNTPLHHAAMNQDYGHWVCRLLLAWNANASLKNQDGETAAMIAARKGMDEFTTRATIHAM